MTHDPTRDCEHGRLKGKCDVCDLQAEINRLVSFNNQLMDEVARLQKREWVGLTDEEIFVIKHIWITTSFATHLDFARAIEDKLKAKNERKEKKHDS
jgi:hypothetical protein